MLSFGTRSANFLGVSGSFLRSPQAVNAGAGTKEAARPARSSADTELSKSGWVLFKHLFTAINKNVTLSRVNSKAATGTCPYRFQHPWDRQPGGVRSRTRRSPEALQRDFSLPQGAGGAVLASPEPHQCWTARPGDAQRARRATRTHSLGPKARLTPPL